MLLPVLKEMTKDFLKFAVLVVVAYTGNYAGTFLRDARLTDAV